MHRGSEYFAISSKAFMASQAFLFLQERHHIQRAPLDTGLHLPGEKNVNSPPPLESMNNKGEMSTLKFVLLYS